jgi:hypothetical protein
MRKRWNPGCPCCGEEPPGDCECDTTIRIDIYDSMDTAVFFQVGGFGGDIMDPEYICCQQTLSGFSAMDGTYILDVSGTPDYSDTDYDYFILNTVAALENVVNTGDMECDLMVAPSYYCVWIQAIYRKSKVPDTCVGNVIFKWMIDDQATLPPTPPDPCDLNSIDRWGQTNPTLDFSYCLDFTGLSAELLTAGVSIADYPCVNRFWGATYDITNPV